MPNALVQVNAYADSELPRDRVVNTFHLNVQQPVGLLDPDWDALARDTAAAFRANWYNRVANWKLNVRIYDLSQSVPRAPQADHTSGDATPESPVPREVAMCLSYYADLNRAHRRGRMYLPAF